MWPFHFCVCVYICVYVCVCVHIIVRQGERQRKEVCMKDIFVLQGEKTSPVMILFKCCKILFFSFPFFKGKNRQSERKHSFLLEGEQTRDSAFHTRKLNSAFFSPSNYWKNAQKSGAYSDTVIICLSKRHTASIRPRASIHNTYQIRASNLDSHQV